MFDSDRFLMALEWVDIYRPYHRYYDIYVMSLYAVSYTHLTLPTIA